jgi:gas vesicle protein
MSDERCNGAGGVVVAFTIGALVGAAVALLLAPASGQETREFLSERAKEGKEKATEAAKRTKEYLARQKETVTAAVERGREAYRGAREKEQA